MIKRIQTEVIDEVTVEGQLVSCDLKRNINILSNFILTLPHLIKSFAYIEDSGLYLGGVEAGGSKASDLIVPPSRVLSWHSEGRT